MSALRLINQRAVRERTLSAAKDLRARAFTRVSKEFLQDCETNLAAYIVQSCAIGAVAGEDDMNDWICGFCAAFVAALIVVIGREIFVWKREEREQMAKFRRALKQGQKIAKQIQDELEQEKRAKLERDAMRHHRPDWN